jgi:H+/Cl- antiporter ClcA
MEPAVPQKLPRAQVAIAVLWPSFAVAIVATGLFFSAFHPRDLVPFNLDIEVSPLAAYSIGFFFFWLLGILAGFGTIYFALTNARLCGRQIP